MNKDICHCEGVNCELKELCVRYIAHTKRDSDDSHLQYAKPRHVGKYCELFWRNHEEN